MFNHIRQFGVFQIFLAVLLLSATVPAMEYTENAPGYKPDSVASFILANCGKTDYHIITAADADELTRAAAADLAATLQEITGADFSAAAGKRYRIFVGISAPSDKTPLKKFERRIVSCNGNLYIYGEGRYGNNNAVYDFLRDELGCRWFNVSGDRRIPKQRKLVIGELKKSIVPSIPYMTADQVNDRTPGFLAFARRNGIVDEQDNFIGNYHLHAGQRIIPSGKIPFGGRLGNTFGPIECLKDKKYFDTDPEYFSMDKRGKRVITMQLCYSNMKMRDEFVRNLEIMLKAGNYRGGRKLIGVAQDDNGGPFCYCPECKALEKKYDHPAGAYYDFLLDLSARFAEMYPELMLCFLAYRSEQTLYPAPCMKKLPANLLPSYAPLGCDFSKPLNYRATNAIQEECFRQWANISVQMHWWSYPTPYPRPVFSFPLVANIHRIAENFRFACRNKSVYAYCQFGAGFYNSFGFNDMRAYLLAQLCRDITLDEQKIIAEYAEGCYGKAAPVMLKYLAELEKLEAGTKLYLRWNPDVLHLPYTTGSNLLRWEREFDEMEKLVSGDPRALLNIRRARYNLDLTLLARWPYLTEDERKTANTLETVIARAEQTIIADQSDLYRELRTNAPRRYNKFVRNRQRWLRSGLEQYAALARGGNALPAQFAKIRKLYRLLPNRNKSALDVDTDAPFGLSNKGIFPEKSKSWFYLRSYDPSRKPAWSVSHPPLLLGVKRTKNRLDGQYRYLRLGKMPVSTADSMLSFHMISRSSSFCLTPVYDPEHPDRLYEFVILVAFAPDKSWVKVAELLVIPTDETAGSASGMKEDPGMLYKDTQDEFF